MVKLKVESGRHFLSCGWVTRLWGFTTLLLEAFGHHNNWQKILCDRKSTEKVRPNLPFDLRPG